MPKVTIWIREEDLDRWESIVDRPEWLHNALKQQPRFIGYDKNGEQFGLGEFKDGTYGIKVEEPELVQEDIA